MVADITPIAQAELHDRIEEIIQDAVKPSWAPQRPQNYPYFLQEYSVSE